MASSAKQVPPENNSIVHGIFRKQISIGHNNGINKSIADPINKDKKYL